MTYVITGGAGYLGSHLAKALVDNYDANVVVIDNYINGLKMRLGKQVQLIDIDILSPNLAHVLKPFGEIKGLFHLAAKKSVSESLNNPKLYQKINVEGTQNVLDLCAKLSISQIVFTSSAAVYGSPIKNLPLSEMDAAVPINPYGKTKLIGEGLISNFSRNSGASTSALRVFNISGTSHPKLFDFDGENVIPILLGKISRGLPFSILGHKLDTFDGTCVRDYIHVSDVAGAHIAAMKAMEQGQLKEQSIFNISSGIGTSVLELLSALEIVSQKQLKREFCDPREGDPISVVGDNSRARHQLGWEPKKSIQEIMSDSWSAQIAK